MIETCFAKTPAISLSDLPLARPLRILALPDLHIPFGARQKRLLLRDRRILDQHDWVVLLGDMTACYGTSNEYEAVDRFIAAMQRPYSVVNGNHEFSFVPCNEESGAYGQCWQPAPAHVRQQQLQVFENFYQIQSRFQSLRHRNCGILLLGVDNIAPDSSATLWPNHQLWLRRALDELDDLPLLVFCHFPAADQRLQRIRYYEAGRRPFLELPVELSERFQARNHPTFWISGHLHLAPTHPLSEPYLTDDDIWQIHCPDGWGFGRPDDRSWSPSHHDDYYITSIRLERERLAIQRLDLTNLDSAGASTFDLNACFGTRGPVAIE